MKFLELKIPPPLLILIAALLMGGVAYLGTFPLPIPFLWRCVFFGIILFGGGVFLMSSVKLFNKMNTTWLPEDPTKTTALVTGGLYRFSRNPMYLVWTALLVGWGVLLGSGLAFLFVPVFMLYLTHFQIIPEERALEELFGDEYRNYKKRVRRWI